MPSRRLSEGARKEPVKAVLGEEAEAVNRSEPLLPLPKGGAGVA